MRLPTNPVLGDVSPNITVVNTVVIPIDLTSSEPVILNRFKKRKKQTAKNERPTPSKKIPIIYIYKSRYIKIFNKTDSFL